jgi:acyl carrier protein
MRGSQDTALKTELKQLILTECDLDITPDEIGDDEPLFGKASRLGLDSIDGLQISVALQKRFGLRIGDSKVMRRILVSIDTLADFLQPQ